MLVLKRRVEESRSDADQALAGVAGEHAGRQPGPAGVDDAVDREEELRAEQAEDSV